MECGTTYKLDFMEFWATDEPEVYDIKFVDVKSAPTAAKESFRIKMRMLKHEYPIVVECRSADGTAVDEDTRNLDLQRLGRSPG